MCRRRRGHIHAIRHGYTLSISFRSRIFRAFFRRMKSPTVGDGAIDAPSERLPTYVMAITLRTLHNALLRKAAQFSDLRLLFCAFFRRPKERTKESANVSCGGKIFPQNRESLIKRNGIVTSFALFLLRQPLEILHRLTRSTCTSQNPAIAPQTTCGLLTYTVLKALG